MTQQPEYRKFRADSFPTPVAVALIVITIAGAVLLLWQINSMLLT